MTGTVLERSLARVSQRLQRLRVLRRQTACWLILLFPCVVATLWLPSRAGFLKPELLVSVIAATAGILVARCFVRNPTNTETARLIEQADPTANDAVLTAVQVYERTGHRPSVLAAMAIQEADRLARQRDWSVAIPGRQIRKWTVFSFLSFLLMVSSVLAAGRYGRGYVASSRHPDAAVAGSDEPSRGTELVVEPGDVELERGAALTVVARFPAAVPLRALLEFRDENGNVRQQSMLETVDAGVFAVRMENISGDGSYRVLFEESGNVTELPRESSAYRVSTFIRPRLEQIDAVVTPPAWAGKPQEVVEDVSRLTVTEGSQVTLRLTVNKPVALASLRSRYDDVLPLSPSIGDPRILEVTLTATDSTVWTVLLQDEAGRNAAEEEQISIRVTANQPPRISMTFPGRDTNVSPLQEFVVEAALSDDFGLIDYGIQYSLSGSEPKEYSLKTLPPQKPDNAARETGNSENTAHPGPSPELKVSASHRILMESLNAAPDDILTYSFWATDLAADGTERRIRGDLAFAEVRRFEEIFREAQQGGGQQAQQNQQQGERPQESAVDGVLQLQKEIISATWNTLRNETVLRGGDSFREDIGTIADSQAAARDQLEQSMQQMGQDPATLALGQRAMDEMSAARQMLEDVRDDREGARLSLAMSLEQTVLQSLLKMRAAEFQVRQQQQQQGGGSRQGGSNSASQQQLQQLELDNSRNRYESERQAQQQQEEMTQQQREQLQILNRLKELARRQQMLNERLKQLESELRAALSDKEKEEIERELKRLRDEQREMLRDVDELTDRMDQTNQQSAGSQSESSSSRQERQQQEQQRQQMREQMREARNNVQQASRSMDAGRLAEAIAEGTRAERQFEDLKESFRNQTSQQFEDAVRDLKSEAAELSSRQQELARNLAGETTENESAKRPSLRADRNRDELKGDAAAQRDRLRRVVDETRQLIEQAEQTEPLLSNRLYETLRELKDSKPDEALEAIEFLAGRGLWPQSQEAERIAQAGIEKLKKGIDKAAESVLGGQSQALRRAQSQLDEATRQLAGEVRQATGSTRDGEADPQDASEARSPRQSGSGNADDRYEDGSQSQSQRGRRTREGDSQSDSGNPNQGDRSPDQEEETASGGRRGNDKNPDAGSGEPEEPGDRSSVGTQSAQEENQQGRSGQGAEPSSGQRQQSGAASNRGSDSEAVPSESEGEESSQMRNADPSANQSASERSSSLRSGGREAGGGGRESVSRPLTGDDYGAWSDRLRDIEDMLDDPELRNRVAQVRERARGMRADYKRHGAEPQWDLVKSQLLTEMQTLQLRLQQEIARLESDRAMVPIDREPVPEEFDRLVQQYYELLGQERLPPTQR